MRNSITGKQFNVLVKPFLGKTINRSWKGHGSALFLEVGELTRNIGELTIMIEWSWRVEKLHSIWFGSWSDESAITKSIPKLTGHTLQEISLFSRLPEITVKLSNDLWVSSFSTVEGNPNWALILPNTEAFSENGKLFQKQIANTEPNT